MTDTITITGIVATDPRHITTSEGLSITTFRLASAQRRFDKSQEKWVDADTNWYTITTFRQLAINASTSVRKGERVVVTGRLRIREWDNGERKGTTIDVEADALGHDLAWGSTAFTRNVVTMAMPVAEEFPARHRRAYALDETERFIVDLRDSLAALENPVDRLALYVRAQVEDLSRRHLPPGPAMAAVLSPGSFAKLADHVGDLNVLLQDILQDGVHQGYLPDVDVAQLARLILGTLSASAARRNRTPDGGTPPPSPSSDVERHTAQTVRFIQLGAGARFDDAGRPIRLEAPAHDALAG